MFCYVLDWAETTKQLIHAEYHLHVMVYARYIEKSSSFVRSSCLAHVPFHQFLCTHHAFVFQRLDAAVIGGDDLATCQRVFQVPAPTDGSFQFHSRLPCPIGSITHSIGPITRAIAQPLPIPPLIFPHVVKLPRMTMDRRFYPRDDVAMKEISYVQQSVYEHLRTLIQRQQLYDGVHIFS